MKNKHNKNLFKEVQRIENELNSLKNNLLYFLQLKYGVSGHNFAVLRNKINSSQKAIQAKFFQQQ